MRRQKIVFSYLKVLGRDTQWFIYFGEYLSGRPKSDICIESWTKADLLFGVLSPWTLVTLKKIIKPFLFKGMKNIVNLKGKKVKIFRKPTARQILYNLNKFNLRMITDQKTENNMWSIVLITWNSLVHIWCHGLETLTLKYKVLHLVNTCVYGLW